MFTPQQVKQFKEAFNMIDQDGDGQVTEPYLRAMLSNLGEHIWGGYLPGCKRLQLCKQLGEAGSRSNASW